MGPWALLGFFSGRLINMLADDWPYGRPLVLPLCCPQCGTARPWLQSSGLLAYAVGRSTCAQCGRRIAWRWPLVEAAAAVLFAYLYAEFDFSLTLVIVTLYTAILLLVCVIDFEHRLILSRVILPAIFGAFLLSFITPDLTAAQASAGGLVGFSVTGLIYAGGIGFVKWQARRGRPSNEVAFGQGDVMLMLFIGLITGVASVARALVLGVIFGGLAALAIVVFGLFRRQSVLHIPYAYGPYLALAGWLVLVQNALAAR
ncbi:MAG: prepilin peptidase [Chloroflexi bacterium]|nr:prepilin peptidase [Chloroflexota bacterium]MBI3734251.1 prepilin peptidase [Chloroflexota bacterium]